ncbi:MAG: SpoIIE family protein phosphatase, partial [Solirubrobacterales bacterium]|nr:SpoIIE family protein phosphatase [Solirubrobacterales bacterium]
MEGGGDALIGATLEGLRLAAAEVGHATTIAEAFQRNLLPDRLPEIPGLRVSARYVTGATDTQVGGDWYDVITLRDGLAGVAIGDVVGNGLEAAAKMARLQNALRAYALEGLRPSLVLERMNGFAREAAGGSMATLLYGIVDPERGGLRLAAAGHPPALIIGPHGDAHFAESPAGSPVGVVRFPVYEESMIPLRPATTVLLYTDGLVERPGVSLDEGLDWLRGFAAGVPGGPDELCTALLAERFRETAPADDVAVLAVRLEPVDPERIELTLAADPESLAQMRRALGPWLRAAGADDAETYETLVACGEACANAVAHAYPAGEASYVVEARGGDGAIDLEVRDFGTWRAPRAGSQGRGLHLISALVDEVEI